MKEELDINDLGDSVLPLCHTTGHLQLARIKLISVVSDARWVFEFLEALHVKGLLGIMNPVFSDGHQYAVVHSLPAVNLVSLKEIMNMIQNDLYITLPSP